MAEAKYQVELDGRLSKPYSIDRLRAFREQGKIDDRSTCTADRGETWSTLAAVLSDDHTDSTTSDVARRLKPAPMVGVSKESGGLHSSSSGVDHEAMLSEITALDGKVTAEEMFQRRGRNAPTGRELTPPPEHASSSSVASVPELEVHSDSSQAALVALKRVQKKRGTNSDEVLLGSHSGVAVSLSTIRPLLAGGLAGAIAGMAAALIGGQMLLKAPVAHAIDPASALLQQADRGPLSNREITAHLQVLSAQLKHVAEQSTADLSHIPVPESFELLTRPPVPLQTWKPPQRSPRSIAAAEESFRQYVDLVRKKGPDGRQLNTTTVENFSDRMAELMIMPGETGSSRADAARDLAEKTKLLYLLQLGNLRSDDPRIRASGITTLVNAADAGLRTLFTEFLTHDMSLQMILESATPVERNELLLIRYWCYRAANPAGAKQWLDRMRSLYNGIDVRYITAAINEVDDIE